MRRILLAVLAAVGLFGSAATASASDFSQPWKRGDHALVLDAYENNPIDWAEVATDERIVGFINKGSDGMPPSYRCEGSDTEERLCRALWLRYAVAKELYHTRRALAKSLGLEWGVYHLGRPGDPIDQANHLIDFAEPGPDDLIAIDIEDNDPEKWMSLEDAEEFARHIHRRLGRFPVLYTNGSTAEHIARNRDRYRLLSRLPLWYARYKPEIGLHFPKGHWESYALWQFSSQANCNDRACPYRVPGTQNDIDVNVAAMDAKALRAAWPFGGLIEETAPAMASVPVPVRRELALAGKFEIVWASVAAGDSPLLLAESAIGRGMEAPAVIGRNELEFGFRATSRAGLAGLAAIDRMSTGSIGREGPFFIFSGRPH